MSLLCGLMGEHGPIITDAITGHCLLYIVMSLFTQGRVRAGQASHHPLLLLSPRWGCWPRDTSWGTSAGKRQTVWRLPCAWDCIRSSCGRIFQVCWGSCSGRWARSGPEMWAQSLASNVNYSSRVESFFMRTFGNIWTFADCITDPNAILFIM